MGRTKTRHREIKKHWREMGAQKQAVNKIYPEWDDISPGRLVARADWEAGEATTDATSRDRVLFQARH